MATKNLTVFLNYKNSTVKCLITKSLKSEIQFLQTQFPGRIFPANTILINKRTKLAVSNLNDISVLSGDVISVKIPRTQSRPVPLENVLHLKTVKKDANLIKLKKFFKLDEKTFAENFIFDEKFGKDGIEISCFLELPDNISIENVLSKNNKVFEDKVIAVERLSDKTRDRYNNLKRKMKVVYVKNCPDDTVAADLRIFFPDIAIYAAHILSSGVAFLETTESQIDSLLHYNNKPNLLAGHKLELRESNYENLCEALRKSNFEAEEKKRQDHLNQKRKKSDSVTEEYSLAKRPTDFDKTGNKQNLVKNENLSSSTTKKAKYINEDFKCAKMTNIPSGCSELDVARFFDGSIQILKRCENSADFVALEKRRIGCLLRI
ncbi:hypothetical protein MHBO_002035 [Bonamia ostreae]|uniref:Uncharacterized protein n=1 Tax=Bonamia ostreae TaxID=126728 RepID=A0ABV2AL17_9EUKA